MTDLQPGPRDGAEATLSKEQFKREVMAILPQLRAFARGICGSRDLADDLAQEAMMRAWASRHTFKVGTNFKAWMFIILRNRCYSMAKKNSRFVTWDPEAAERILVAPSTQHVGIDLMDVQRALDKLPTEQREMLMLVAADMSYEEAAEITGGAIGTPPRNGVRIKPARSEPTTPTTIFIKTPCCASVRMTRLAIQPMIPPMTMTRIMFMTIISLPGRANPNGTAAVPPDQPIRLHNGPGTGQAADGL